MADTDLFTEQIVSSMSQQEIEETKSTLQDGRLSMDAFTLLFEIYNNRAEPPLIIPAIQTLKFDRQLNLLNSSQFETIQDYLPDLPIKYVRKCNPMLHAYFKSRSELKMTRVEEWTSKEVPIS
eukprot:259884_1